MEVLDGEREKWERQERERRGMFAQDEVGNTSNSTHMETFRAREDMMSARCLSTFHRGGISWFLGSFRERLLTSQPRTQPST